MSMESNLHALLSAICSQVFPDVAPANVARPFVTWQAIGGETLRNLDNTTGNKRNTYLQINVWSDSRLSSLNLIRSIEDSMCASLAFVARPEGEPLSTFEPDTKLYGSLQRFSIWSGR